METITFNYKTKVEQFKEQFPELYADIYQLGYMDATKAMLTDDDHYEDERNYDEDNNPFNYQPEYAMAEDDSPRYFKIGKWHEIYEKAVALVIDGYKAGNRDWEDFMKSYKDWPTYMYIAWNPTHKQFAIESDPGTIDELYPHLVNAKRDIPI